MKRLSVREQRKLIKALPSHRRTAVKKHCQLCQQRGEGLGDILKSIGRVLGPISKEVGPTVLKELIVPLIKKKISGGALKLAGQGKKKRRK